MALVFKINRAKFKKNEIKKDQNGFLIVPVYFMRTGILLYRDYQNDEILKDYVSPQELFNPDSMASASGMVFTEDHPEDMVYPDNFRQLINGTIHQIRQEENIYIAGTLTVYDGTTARSIENSDKDEVSAGYWTDIIKEPGITPDNESYDELQTNIRYNHTARVWFGRAGEEVALKKNYKLNGADIPVFYEQIDNKKPSKFLITQPQKKNINDKKGAKKMALMINNHVIELEKADEMVIDNHLKDLEAKKNQAETELNEIKNSKAELEAKADNLEKEKSELEKKLNAFEAKENEKELKELKEFVKPILADDFKENSTDLELKKAVLLKEYPEMSEKFENQAYLNTAFDLFKASYKKDSDNSEPKYNEAENQFNKGRQLAASSIQNGSLSSHQKTVKGILEKI